MAEPKTLAVSDDNKNRVMRHGAPQFIPPNNPVMENKEVCEVNLDDCSNRDGDRSIYNAVIQKAKNREIKSRYEPNSTNHQTCKEPIIGMRLSDYNSVAGTYTFTLSSETGHQQATDKSMSYKINGRISAKSPWLYVRKIV